MVMPGARMLEHASRAAARNGEVRLERGERRQHERALDDAGVRHLQPLGRDRLPAIEQQVEIDRPRRPPAAVLAAERAFDLLQAVQDRGRRGPRAAMSDEIEKRLIPIGRCVVGQHRRRLDDGRHAHEIDAMHRELTQGPGEVIAAIAEVRAEPEVNIHDCSRDTQLPTIMPKPQRTCRSKNE